MGGPKLVIALRIEVDPQHGGVTHKFNSEHSWQCMNIEHKGEVAERWLQRIESTIRLRIAALQAEHFGPIVTLDQPTLEALLRKVEHLGVIDVEDVADGLFQELAGYGAVIRVEP